MTFTIDEIKALRAGITPGEWERSSYTATPAFRAILEHTVVCKQEDAGLLAITGPVDDRQSIIDAEFIAASPAIVDQLLEENERLKTVCTCGGDRRVGPGGYDVVVGQAHEIERLKAEIRNQEKMIAGLMSGMSLPLFQDKFDALVLRARAAEDVAVENHWRYVVEHKREAVVEIKKQIDKRVAELKDERCEHGVWKADHCYKCEEGK